VSIKVLTPLKCGRRLNIKKIILKTKKRVKSFMSLFDNEKAKGQWEEEVVGEGKAMATKENGLESWIRNSKNYKAQSNETEVVVHASKITHSNWSSKISCS